VDPPPPVPRAVLEHVFGIDSPDVFEGFVYGSLQIKRPQVALDIGGLVEFIEHQ
jgi:hypothetical protein